MLWDNGGRFDRRTLQWRRSGALQSDHGQLEGPLLYGESDLIFVRKDATDQDTVVPLRLNDNVLTSITNGDYELVEGTDYVLNGEDLTVKADYLAKLTESAELGEVAVIKAQFNKGADWTFHVLYNDTPSCKTYEGTTDQCLRFRLPSTATVLPRWRPCTLQGATQVRITGLRSRSTPGHTSLLMQQRNI